MYRCRPAKVGCVILRTGDCGRRVAGRLGRLGERHQPSSSMAPGVEEDEILSDVGHSIGDALEVVGDEHQVGRPEDRGVVLGHHLDQVVEEAVIDAVDPVIPGSDAARLEDIARDHGGEDAAHLVAAVGGHLGDVDVCLQRRQVGQVARELGDAHAVVAHALQLRGHVEQPDDLAKLARLRALVDDEREGQLAQLALAVVDQRVVRDHTRAEAHVALGEAARRLGDGRVDKLAHVRDDPAQVGQLVPEGGVVRVQQWLAHLKRL